MAALLVTTALVAPVLTPASAAAAPAGPAQPSPAPGTEGGRSEQERAMRYFDMTFQEAMYTAMVEGDLEFAMSALASLGSATDTQDLVSFVSGVQALKTGDFAAAETAFEAAQSGDLSAAALLMVSRVQLGKTDAAIEAWSPIGAKGGGQPFFRPWRGWLAERAGKPDEALTLWREADGEQEFLFCPQLAKRYFVMLARADGADVAVARIDELFGPPETQTVEMRALRGAIRAGRGQLPELSPAQAGAEILADLVTLNQLMRMTPTGPDDPDEQNPDSDFVNDVLTLRTAMVLEPGNGRVRSLLADVLSEYGEPVRARAVLEAPGGPPPNADTLMELAAFAFDAHQVRDGVAFLERVPEGERSSYWHAERASGAFSLGEFDRATQLGREGIRLAQATGDDRVIGVSHWRAAGIEFARGSTAEGERLLAVALDKLEKDDIVRAYIGLMLARYVPARRAEGIAIARTLQGQFGDTPFFRAALGSALVNDEATLEEGIELLRAAVEGLPRSPDMLNSLGYTLVEKEVDVDQGFLLLQQAHERLPENAAIVDSLGWAYYLLGHLEEAKTLIERSAELFAEDPNAEVFDHLGDIYWHLGRRDEAREQWRKALPLAAGYSGAAAIPGKIERGLTTPPPPRRPIPVRADPDSV
jgi:tetratricopeptide (TPR) repeat protein